MRYAELECISKNDAVEHGPKCVFSLQKVTIKLRYEAILPYKAGLPLGVDYSVEVGTLVSFGCSADLDLSSV